MLDRVLNNHFTLGNQRNFLNIGPRKLSGRQVDLNFLAAYQVARANLPVAGQNAVVGFRINLERMIGRRQIQSNGAISCTPNNN